ncbi:MAG: ABC transporter substrate-binding protein [Syntrophobacterales bacterium]|nr:ABC transporter substrate-binding protein [Syntrophobacterales bacterium]
MQKKNKLLLLLGALGVFIFFFSINANAKPSITIHNITDLTGAYAPIAIPSEKGGKDYLAWIKEQGGLDVDGDGKGDVDVEYKWAEFGNVDARFMSAYKRFRMGKPKPTIIEMWSSPNQEMIKPILERDQIVAYGIGFSDPQLYPPAWNYMDCWSYGESAAGAIEYYIDNLWPKRGKGIKAKVAHLTWDTAYGRGAIEPTKRHGQKTGKYEVVAERFCTLMPTDPEIMGFLSDFEKRGIDIIWSNSIVQTPAVIQKGIQKLGLSDKMVLMANLWAPADQLLNIVGPKSAEGYLCAQPVFVPAAEPNEPGVKFAKMLNDKYRKDPSMPNIQYMRGIRMKANMLESVRRALNGIMKRDKVDLATACNKITGKDVKELGIQTLAGYNAHGTTSKYQSAPAGKDDRRLANHDRIVGIKNGKVVVLSPWYKVPRLVPDEMVAKGLFKDEKININYVPVK